MSHSCSYPCAWCYSNKNSLERSADLRTIKNIRENYKAWCDSGSKEKNAKFYKNCINLPIFSGEEDTKVLDIIILPELHLMIGVLDKIVDHMRREFEDDTNKWLVFCDVDREVRHNGAGFKGNSCIKLLDNIDY